MAAARSERGGLGLALASAASFGTSGTFATSLLGAGWSPLAAVTARIAIAAVVLTPLALVALRGRWLLMRRAAGSIAIYGLLAVAACQLCYFNAVQRIDVGVALLLEYLGGVLVVGWVWLRHGQRPTPLMAAGAVTAIVGLALVLGVTGPVHLDAVGVLWALAAAVGMAVYYVISARAGDPVPPLVRAWSGMVVGAVVLPLAALTGVLPVQVSGADVRLLGQRVSFAVPVLGLSLVAAVVAYVAGIAAARRLGPRLSSFVGLTEVVFAVLFAWLALGQLPGPLQLLGGVVVVTGVAFVRAAELAPGRGDVAPELVPEAAVNARRSS